MKLHVHIVGDAPLIFNNGQMADPQYYYNSEKKKITSKRKKVDADNEEIHRLSYLGSLYTDKKGKVCLPAKVIQGTLVSGAKGLKDGRAAKAGIFVETNTMFKYNGPTDPSELYQKPEYVSREVVKQQQSRIVRVRPIFPEWEVEFDVSYLEDVTNKENIQQMLEYAGRFCGIGDWRPQHGRFSVKSVKEVK